MTNNATLINQTSGKTEYYTPAEIVDAARETMGGIDLDPASSLRANLTVQAKYIYTAEEDGLTKPWYGRVWMNHPFSRAGNPLWTGKLIDEYSTGGVWQACCITYAATSELWFQRLYNFPMCFLSPRTNYLLPDGTIYHGVPKGSVVVYMGNYPHLFKRHFAKLGNVMVKA